MKKIFTLLCAVALVACGTQPNNDKVDMKVTADLTNEPRLSAGDEIKLVVSGDDEVLATVTLDDNKCFETTINTYPQQYVSLQHPSGTVVELLTDGKDLSVSQNDEGNWEVVGTPYNKIMNDCMAELQNRYNVYT